MKKLLKPITAMIIASMILTTFGCSKTINIDKSSSAIASGSGDPSDETTAPGSEQEGEGVLKGIVLYQADNPMLMWDVDFPLSEAGAEDVFGHPNLTGLNVVPTIVHDGTKLFWNGIEYKAGDSVMLEEINTVAVHDSNGDVRQYSIKTPDRDRDVPTVIINTNGAAIENKIDYVDAEISVLGSDNDFYNAVAQIKLRGNSTMGYDKKPYRIKFDEKQNVLGLGKAKSWVLLANYLDPASMRGELAFGLASRINENTAETTGHTVFAPRLRPVEVYLNYEYIGLYDLGDHMQADDIRVAIDESGDDGSTETDIGYFIEVEVKNRVLLEGAEGYEDWSAYSYIETPNLQDNELYFQFKLPEEPTEEQKAYITDYMQNVNDLILAKDEAVLDYIDLDSFVDWYIVNELFKNTDSHMQSSIYLHKDKGGKLYMGPVWDFDLSTGSQTALGLDDPEGFWTRRTEYCGWFNALYEMEAFTSKLSERWAELRDEGIIDAIFTDMDTFVENVGAAAEADYSHWHENYTATFGIDEPLINVPEIAISGEWSDQVEYLRSFLTNRIAWFDDQMGYVAAENETEAEPEVETEITEDAETTESNTEATEEVTE